MCSDVTCYGLGPSHSASVFQALGLEDTALRSSKGVVLVVGNLYVYLGSSESTPLLSPQGDRGLTGTPGEPGVKVCKA